MLLMSLIDLSSFLNLKMLFGNKALTLCGGNVSRQKQKRDKQTQEA